MKSEHLHIRIGKEDQIRLEQMKEYHGRKISLLVRCAIQFAYDNAGGFDYYMARLDKMKIINEKT